MCAIDYKKFLSEIRGFIADNQIFTDDLRLFAWGTDAGFYRLIPKVVIYPETEEQVSKLLSVCDKLNVDVTFRAAGTSLSGQAISESVIIVAGKKWDNYTLAADASYITMQPGIIGERVNEILKPHGRRFSPDPASVKSAMVGGIVSNNASGMNCGTHANSAKMILSARIVFADGTILDTKDEKSRKEFIEKKKGFIEKIENIRDRILTDNQLFNHIKQKYSIKNVMGLNVEPFVTHSDPFDILLRLLVGSEGTLAFISQVSMKTEHDHPYKACAMLYFSDIEQACRAVQAMKKLKNVNNETIVKGAELLDEKSLQSVKDTTGTGLTAVLTETKADSSEELLQNIDIINKALQPFETFVPVYFTDKEAEYSKYWLIRSGIFPSVGGTRKQGTTSLIEDVAFHIDYLPQATVALQKLLINHGYDDACIYGHALEGNYHFIINQSFDTEEDVERYKNLMKDVVELVVNEYNGSLKAEHGTGRNMAPFVEYEWGTECFEIMKEIKQLFDPKGLLNPGVIFNDDPLCYLKNFKSLPLVSPTIDKCIECGFCEVNCLTCGFTLSSRQRIVVQREIARLKNTNENPKRLRKLQKQYKYMGEQTCAADGLCALSCPMSIDTGKLTHEIRKAKNQKNSITYFIYSVAAKNFAAAKGILKMMLRLLNCVKFLHRFLPFPTCKPLSSNYLNNKKTKNNNLKVVYFPSCINQTIGEEKSAKTSQPLINEMADLLNKAGFDVIFPENMKNLCCGTIWESKGMFDIADNKTFQLEEALYKASEGGKYPVLCDHSSCIFRIKNKINKLKVYEPIEFINTFLFDKLEFKQSDTPVSLHITCSIRKMGLSDMIVELAKRCSSNVLVPEEIKCCGFAGDKGFLYPQVNQYALRKLRPQLEKANVKEGYSTSRTCEVGLTKNAQIPYQSIVYLVNKSTRKRTQ